MNRVTAIANLFGIKDLTYELLEWLESIGDEEFESFCSGEQCLPEEVYHKLLAFNDFSSTIANECKAIVKRSV